MGWLSKIFGGSSHSHRISEGQYHGQYGEDSFWDGPTISRVIALTLNIPLFCLQIFIYAYRLLLASPKEYMGSGGLV